MWGERNMILSTPTIRWFQENLTAAGADLFRDVTAAARARAPLAVIGPPGSGKHVVARWVHFERGGGVIVNISSGAATSALEGWSHYCSSKAGALSLTRCAERENRESPVRVVGLSPGTVATEMQVAIRGSGVNPVSRLDPSVHIPGEWVAQAIGWLCGPDAAEFRGVDVSLRDENIRRRVGLAV